MKKWEYIWGGCVDLTKPDQCIIQFKGHGRVSLAQLGSQGWELAGIYDGSASTYFFFKREVQDNA